ncbi:MAG TPA: bacillithiol biosynthesis cysteine-adding enzyme BshC, partial [Vicinamibacterales bacterium]|nr:bacillithiol biosynthesis cysteine-adding enzyme BshC [Vicinamibacterales bacterium]
LKAVTAIQLARRLRDQRIAAVPVFWVEAEDHDWAEVRSTKVIDREGAVAAVTAADVPGAGSLPVARLTFDAGIAQTLSELRDRLPATEFTDETIASLEHRYRAGAPVGRAFAGWIEDLLGRHGLVVFEADDPTLKPVVRDLFAHELAGRPAARLAREQAGVMRSLGHAPQVETTEDGVSVFYVDAAGRRAIRVKDGQYLVGDQLRPVEDVRAEALDHPERFSPNVLLRPLVQDRLFPTACYVGGPAELAYQAQIGPLYREFGVEAPLLYSRGSATIVDGGAARFLDRSGLPLESLQPQDDGTLNRLLQEHLPGGVERTLAEINEIIATRVTALGQAVSPIDPTLSGAVDTTAERMRETLKTLQNKIVQAAKRKDETLRRQFTRTRALVFPDGDPQERALGIAFFVNRYGPALGDRLLDVLPVETDKHYVLVL